MHADAKELEHVERILADAMTSADPWDALREALARPDVPDAVRASFAHASEDSFRIAGLLVAKLRFERVLNGSARAAEWFERDPRAFTDAFRAFHTSVAPRELLPGLEARAFERWVDERAD